MPEKSTKRAKASNARRAHFGEVAELAEHNRSLADAPSPEEAAWVEEICGGPRAFFRDCLWVPHIDGGKKVPFDLNWGQDQVMGAVEKQLAANQPVRLIILKSRRWGISSFCEGLAYWHTSTREFVNGMVMAQTREVTEDIFQIAKGFYDDDERRGLGMRPELEVSSKKELKFGRRRGLTRGLQSTLSIQSADGQGVGRGSTLHFFHGTEVAYWARDDVMGGVGIALSYAPGTVGILESTANGYGNLYEATWTRAYDGQNEWSPIFLPWFRDPRNRSNITEQERMEWDWKGQVELSLATKYNLSLDQVKWRRLKLASDQCFRPGVAPEDVFRQEWPSEPEEAFMSSGSNFFLVSGLHALRDSPKGKKLPLYRARIENKTPLHERAAFDRTPLEPLIHKEPWGALQVWEEPRADEDYVIGADVAEGLAHGDNSVAVVIGRSSRKVAAVWTSRAFSAGQFGAACCLLGCHYGNALLGIEHNNHGLAAIDEATRLLYPNLWHDQDITKTGSPSRDRVGWRTTEATRQWMLDTLEREIREQTISIHSEEFFKEAGAFVNVNGKPTARVGHHDDEIMATAIAVQMHIHGGAPIRSRRRVAVAPKNKDLPNDKRIIHEPPAKKSRVNIWRRF